MSSSKAIVARREIDVIEFAIFTDLLTRISRFHSLTDFAYGGMSGFALDDMKSLYRTFGLRRMLAFDESKHVVARQRFNRPNVENRVLIASMEDFASGWQDHFVQEGIEDAKNYILWVRRDTADDVGHGVRFFQQMVGSLPEFGIARITLKIDYRDWHGPEFDGSTRRTAVQLQTDVAAKASKFLSDFLEVSDTSSPLDEAALCRCLAKAYGNAASIAVGESTGKTFEPLSVIRYGEGVVELTITGMVIGTEDLAGVRAHIADGDWPFSSVDWGDIKSLRLPDLTMKERFEIEASVGNKSRAVGRLKFDLDDATGEKLLFESFSRYHRYLPTLVAADL